MVGSTNIALFIFPKYHISRTVNFSITLRVRSNEVVLLLSKARFSNHLVTRLHFSSFNVS